MRIEQNKLAFAYLRLSREESQAGESSSITNQRMIITKFCEDNGLNLVREFVDDGYSGGNFNRPGFQEMISELKKNAVKVVITKDLSRLGRDMIESGFYAEKYFPENGIRYIAIGDNFDSESENMMFAFNLAMNETYLREVSRKVKEVLKAKRQDGLYCACPPYGYKKAENNKNQLVPDDNTTPIVKRIFNAAANGDSSRKIAQDLNTDGVLPPLKYRALYRDKFSEKGAARVSDLWNYTTVKRILKNEVYLGHTVLGKSRKASIKSTKKLSMAKEDWSITKNTHEPLVSEEIFKKAQHNMGKGTRDFQQYDHVRKSIFSGIAYCALCGHALCSCGTVYKGEREKYWYLSCINKRKDINEPCIGTRIRYADLLELVRNDLNSLISLNDKEISSIVEHIMQDEKSNNVAAAKKLQREKLQSRLNTIDTIIHKLYVDNAEGRLEDDRLYSMVDTLQKEASQIKKELLQFNDDAAKESKVDNYKMFFDLTKKYSHIEVLDRDTVLTFIDRIEVGPKILPDGKVKATHRNSPFQQSVRIFYKFIGEMDKP